MSYYEDEYYEDEYYEDERDQAQETSHSVEIYKARNGQVFVVETYGWRAWGQDWGETRDDQWHIERRSLRECRDDFRAAVLPIIKELKPGGKANVTDWYIWIEDEESNDVPF